MKLSQPLSRHHPWWKYTDKEKYVHFKPEAPMRLKESVAGNALKTNSNACIQEMFVMMACLKENEFNQSNCTEQIGKYRHCNEVYFAAREQKLLNEHSGKLVPGMKDLSASQVNTLLKKFSSK